MVRNRKWLRATEMAEILGLKDYRNVYSRKNLLKKKKNGLWVFAKKDDDLQIVDKIQVKAINYNANDTLEDSSSTVTEHPNIQPPTIDDVFVDEEYRYWKIMCIRVKCGIDTREIRMRVPSAMSEVLRYNAENALFKTQGSKQKMPVTLSVINYEKDL